MYVYCIFQWSTKLSSEHNLTIFIRYISFSGLTNDQLDMTNKFQLERKCQYLLWKQLFYFIWIGTIKISCGNSCLHLSQKRNYQVLKWKLLSHLSQRGIIIKFISGNNCLHLSQKGTIKFSSGNICFHLS